MLTEAADPTGISCNCSQFSCRLMPTADYTGGASSHLLKGTCTGMPRPRPRPAPCDCLECREPANASSAPGLADAAARQDPPPKLLLVFADGFLRALQAESGGLVHLDAHVQEGSLGMLALREGPLGRSGASSSTERLAELAQLLGLQASICWLHDSQ